MTIGAAINGLKDNPIALALVIVNFMFVTGGIYILRDINATAGERETRNTQLFRECIDSRRG